jgi:hypothetical protein
VPIPNQPVSLYDVLRHEKTALNKCASTLSHFSDDAPVSCVRMELSGRVRMFFSATSYSCIGTERIVGGNPKISRKC